MKNILLISLLFYYPIASQSQNVLKYEGRLIVDNDAFTGDLTQDQYYSSGIYLGFRHLLDSNGSTKIIRSYQLNQRMYTPSWIGEDIVAFMDRPYAGILSLSIAQEYYFSSKNSYLNATLELGWLGPKALVGETQSTWHGWLNMPKPQGWKYQINDSPVINLDLQHIKAFYSNKNMELAFESNARIGTVYNTLSGDAIFRFGRLKPLFQSAFTSSSLGWKRGTHTSKQTMESYFFYSPGLEYVFYNATLEGNLIGEKSVYTVDATKLLWQQRAGVMFSWEVFDLGIIAYWWLKENPEATNHNYVGIRLNQRFKDN
jgi:lipid A 3-O-deacylase